MNKNEKNSLIAIPIVLVIAGVLGVAGSESSIKIFQNIPLFFLIVLIIFLIQWIMFIPSYIFKTEKFFDITGSFTFIISVAIASYFDYDVNSNVDLRTLILFILICIWSGRLGFFLLNRVLRQGGDSRFDEIKLSFARFLATWTIQGLWVSFTLAAALASISSNNKAEFGVAGVIGLLIWLIGFSFESISDYQKNKFKSNPENKGKFITTGLWSRSRHPNYFGEILVWVGIAVIAYPNLQGLALFTLISPVFVILLLTKVSGIPILEKQADERWGDNEEYKKYRENTPVLIPRIK